jgi:peptidyl-tRNA hydrolase, PTH1 family
MFIVGLGNPGKEYENTRHNIGFMFLDFLQSKLNADPFHEEKKFGMLLSTTKINGNSIYLIKPQQFMNVSGKSIREYTSFFKMNINPTNLIVVHDDLDIKLGSWKFSNRPPKGHNGLSSINTELKFSDYVKIRIGIDNRENSYISGIDYVLQSFSPVERKILEAEFADILKELEEHF